jgi:hypothetical protein
MMTKASITPILLTLTLTACATGGFIPSGQCPQNITVKIDGKATEVTAPNSIQGLSNPGMEIIEGRFGIGLIIKEMGIFEILDFDAKNLKVGSFTGEQFRLTRRHFEGTCSHDKYKQDSKLIIEQYNADTDQKLRGCFYGKLNCGGQLIEVNAPISGTVL